MTADSTILVTGGSGLVGQAIKELMSLESPVNERWVFLSSKDGDLTSPAQTDAIFDKYQPTHVIHLAAFVGGLFKNMAHPVEFWTCNTAMNDNLLRAAHSHGTARMISCLSTCIFPDKTSYPIDETMIHDGPPHSSNEPYAYAKRMLEVTSRSYNKQFGTDFKCVIPTNIYGRHDNFHLEDSHVIPGLIHKVYNAKKNGTSLTVAGSGSPLRQFLFAPDLARLIVWTLHNYNGEGPLILSVSESQEVTIKQVVEAIVKAMDFQGAVVFDTNKSDGQLKKTASNAKLMDLNPGFQFTPFDEGIKQTVDWFVDNFDKARK